MPTTISTAHASEIFAWEFGRPPEAIYRFPTGLSNFVFRVGLDSSNYVLRIARSSDRHNLEGSLYWLGRLADLRLALPKVLRSRPEHDPPYAILSYLEGQDLGLVYHELTETQKRDVAQQIDEAQRRLATLPKGPGFGFLKNYDDPDCQPSWKAVVLAHLERSRNRLQARGFFPSNYADAAAGLIERHSDYLEQIQAIPFFDDATTKNVLVHQGAFSGLVDLDWLCFGDRLFTIALTKMALLDSGNSLSYIDYWLEEEKLDPVQHQVFALYVLLFCLDFMSSLGMVFNKGSPPAVSAQEISKYQTLFEQLYNGANQA